MGRNMWKFKFALFLTLLASSMLTISRDSYADDAGQMFRGFLKIIKKAQRHSDARQTYPQQHASSYTVSGITLGQTIDPSSQRYRNYECKASELAAGFSLCMRKTQEAEARGSFTASESILYSQGTGAIYINKSISPAFWTPTEVHDDIKQLREKLNEEPRIQTMPHRKDLPDAVIAVWGKVRLDPLDEEGRRVLSRGGNPNHGILVDFLNNLALSAQRGLPILKLSGEAGYVWIATFDHRGIGRLRFLAADMSALNKTSGVIEGAASTAAVPAANAEERIVNGRRLSENEISLMQQKYVAERKVAQLSAEEETVEKQVAQSNADKEAAERKTAQLVATIETADKQVAQLTADKDAAEKREKEVEQELAESRAATQDAQREIVRRANEMVAVKEAAAAKQTDLNKVADEARARLRQSHNWMIGGGVLWLATIAFMLRYKTGGTRDSASKEPTLKKVANGLSDVKRKFGDWYARRRQQRRRRIVTINLGSAKWFYAVDRTKLGPFSHAAILDLIANETLLPETRVWRAGMKNWATASETPLNVYFQTGNDNRPK